MGYAFPEYINRVYAGYNFGIKKSDSDIIVLVNSDNALLFLCMALAARSEGINIW